MCFGKAAGLFLEEGGGRGSDLCVNVMGCHLNSFN